jgi:hypothetical protein
VDQITRAYLLRDDARNARITVAERIHSNAGCEVQISPVLNVPHITAVPLLKHGWWADIGRDHVRELLIHEAGGLGGGGRIWRGKRRFSL